MVPWLPELLARTRELLGDDYWPYGLAPNPRALDTFPRYSFEQGLARSRLSPDPLVRLGGVSVA